MEVWKKVPDYEEFYQVSNLGRVRSLRFNKIKIMSQKIRKDGYYEVSIYKNKKGKSFKTHQLIAMAFLDHKRCGFKKVVDHIDGDKSNNKLDNLQVVSNRVNTSKDKHKYKKYTKLIGVSKYKDSGKYVAQIKINGKPTYLGSFTDEYEAGRAYQKALREL